MTVYNEEQFISSSVNSILNQSYKNFEFIIINDFSRDNTYNILKNIKDKRLRIYNLNKEIQRNDGRASKAGISTREGQAGLKPGRRLERISGHGRDNLL